MTPSPAPLSTGSVCVIGAGPSGLAFCKNLKQARIAFECFDASRSVGGIWDVEADGNGGGYRSLHTNTSKEKMSYSDFSFPDDVPNFPSHVQMLDYFNAYADHFELRPHIRLNCSVQSAEPTDGGDWLITLDDGEVKDFRACIVATGQYGSRRWPSPEPPGNFNGEVIHSADYLDPVTPVDCRNKRVVVVGLGSSAAEIATELAGGKTDSPVASRTMISARSGRYIMPKLLDGKPLDSNAPHPAIKLPAATALVPKAARLRMARGMIKKAFSSVEEKVGRPEDWNLPYPTFPYWGERPTLSDGFIPALQEGRVEARPGISSFEGSSVKFADGTIEEVDVVIYGTGYELNFPFLKPESLGCEPHDLSLYQRIAHPTTPNLYFAGFTRVLCSLWPLAEQQAIWLVDVLKGNIKLPDAAVQTSKAIQVQRDLPVLCNFHVFELRADAK